MNVPTLEGLAAHPVSGALWGLAHPPALVRVDRTTGLATPIASTLPIRCAGLTFDRTGTWLYASNFDTGEIYQVDPFTGGWQMIGTANAGNLGGSLGLARDPYRDVLYSAELWLGQDARLVEFSLLTGVVTPIAVLSGWRPDRPLRWAGAGPEHWFRRRVRPRARPDPPPDPVRLRGGAARGDLVVPGLAP